MGSSGVEDTVEREGREENVGWELGNDWFLAEFGPDFLPAQAMKCTLFIGGGRGTFCL
jgi:hypothetical protein